METQALNDTIDHLDLIDIYTTFYPKAADYTCFSSAHVTFFRTDHIWGHKVSLSKFKKTEIRSSRFSDHNTIRNKLQEKNYKNSGLIHNWERSTSRLYTVTLLI